eukprot:CAMPEP_0118928202 /NCGR_PEP_ID=MMETSP1169-20130426/5509_1 /TAXON_ID=36882 /ORGANISM="Pyramimonas obovata, Strain CCMP722" /LENGTH=234 /DNA_ID=CAMNT_0006870125 /DNA_START=157 /DNA_END=861 /DNA_ORIENTATION=-
MRPRMQSHARTEAQSSTSLPVARARNAPTSKLVMKGGMTNIGSSRATSTVLSAKNSQALRGVVPLVAEGLTSSSSRMERRQVQVLAGRIDPKDKWWEGKEKLPNMYEIASTSDFLDIMASAGDALVIVDFYARWCGACRALYPKLEQLASQHPEIIFMKVDFDANNAMCKQLGVKVLPFIHCYRGASGRVSTFSCSISKIKRLRNAIEEHNTPRCDISPVPEIKELTETPTAAP